MPFDPAAAKRAVLGREEEKIAQYWSLMDGVDRLIGRALDVIADNDYRRGGTVRYPASISFAELRASGDTTAAEILVAWAIGMTPGGENNEIFYLDEHGSITVEQYASVTSIHEFERRSVKPLYQRSTRSRNDWSVTSHATNPLFLSDLLTTFVDGGGEVAVITTGSRAEHYRAYKEIVGDVIS